MQRVIDFEGTEPPLIDPAALQSWILAEDDCYIVIDKPGWVVCHPSKNGPWSSLIGALREHLQQDVLHLVSRLDRETSGVVVVAKSAAATKPLQQALQQRTVNKTYLALLKGQLRYPYQVTQPLRGDGASQVRVKQAVGFSRTAQQAATLFDPIAHTEEYTLAQVFPITGRKHQIRCHAQWIGHAVVGDKLYGGDESLYLEFIENGWTQRMDAVLPIRRQALHAWKLDFELKDRTLSWQAPLAEDIRALVLSLNLKPCNHAVFRELGL